MKIVYFDTSALLKLYVDEVSSAVVASWAIDADHVASSRITYIEAHAALARRTREDSMAEAEFTSLLLRFRNQWSTVLSIDFDDHLAAELATKHGLRSLDAIHLAAAIAMRHSDPDADFAVACFDTRLCNAMRAEGLPLLSADDSAPGG